MSDLYKSDAAIQKAIEECELIDSILPGCLPLYINYEWSCEESKKRYMERYNDAFEVQALIDQIKSGKYVEGDIEF